MQLAEIQKPLIVIVGPTAVGKTEVSLRLAERLNGEIVSADSRLFYRGMDIGTAKPTQEERRRVPHHLIDVAEPDEVWSLTVFQQAAQEAIEDIQARGRLPFLVGGTGQYVRSVIEGWQPPSQDPDPALRQALERWAAELGPFALHKRLAVLDPEAARNIQAQNVRRTVRALEVIFITGKRFSEQRIHSNPLHSLLIIGLNRPRPELYRRIDARIQTMLDQGMVEEVKALLRKGYSPGLPNLSAIGYREIVDYVEGLSTLEEAVTQMKRMTRQFVRRQANWFKAGDPNIHWFEAGPGVADEIERFIRSGEGWMLLGPGETTIEAEQTE